MAAMKSDSDSLSNNKLSVLEICGELQQPYHRRRPEEKAVESMCICVRRGYYYVCFGAHTHLLLCVWTNAALLIGAHFRHRQRVPYTWSARSNGMWHSQIADYKLLKTNQNGLNQLSITK